MRSPKVPSVGGQPSGVRPIAQVALSLGPRLGPPSSKFRGSESGYWGWRLPLRPLLAPCWRLEVHWAGGSDLTPFIFFLSGCRVSSSALALVASVQTFLLLQVSLAEAGTHCAARAPIGRTGRGGARPPHSAPRGSLAGRAGLGAVRVPPRRVGTLSAASWAGVAETSPGASGREAGSLGSRGSLGTLVVTLSSASRGPALKPASLPRCLLLGVGYFSHLLHASCNIWVLGREVNCFRIPPRSG